MLDYHSERNSDTFFDWLKNVLPLLDDNCVNVIDNVSYHSVRNESCPTSSWKKCDIEKWLEDKGATSQGPIIKPCLMEIINSSKPKYINDVVDEYVKSQGKEVLRLTFANSTQLSWRGHR